MDTECRRCRKVDDFEHFTGSQLFRSTGQGENDFFVIEDDSPITFAEAQQQLEIENKMAAWANGTTNQYFYCDSCHQLLKETQDRLYNEAMRDNQRYKSFQSENTQLPSLSELTSQIKALEQEKESSSHLHGDLSSERAQIRQKIKAAKEKLKQLEEEEAKMWEELTLYENEVQEDLMKQFAVKRKLSYLVESEKKLEATKILTSLFKIEFEAGIGRINGLRLAETSSQERISVAEISSACGLAALLVYLMQKHCTEFRTRYIICPEGSRTTIQPPTGPKVNLFKEEPKSLFSSWFSSDTFDQGLESLLFTTKDLLEWVQRKDPHFHTPYTINPPYIAQGGEKQNVRKSAAESNWNTAMLRLLHLLKLLSDWFANVYEA